MAGCEFFRLPTNPAEGGGSWYDSAGGFFSGVYEGVGVVACGGGANDARWPLLAYCCCWGGGG